MDFLPNDETTLEVEKMMHLIAHLGFSEEEVKAFYGEGNIELKKYEYAFDLVFRGMTRKCFCALGQKKE